MPRPKLAAQLAPTTVAGPLISKTSGLSLWRPFESKKNCTPGQDIKSTSWIGALQDKLASSESPVGSCHTMLYTFVFSWGGGGGVGPAESLDLFWPASETKRALEQPNSKDGSGSGG